MAFGAKTKDMKMPPPFMKKKKGKDAPADDGGDDLDSLFGEPKDNGDEGPEGSDEEEAGEGSEEEAGEDKLADELSEFSDDELEQELERRKNESK